MGRAASLFSAENRGKRLGPNMSYFRAVDEVVVFILLFGLFFGWFYDDGGVAYDFDFVFFFEFEVS